MSESMQTADEILTAAGWQADPGWGRFTYGTCVGGLAPDGNVYVKNWAAIREGHPAWGPDTPDTPEEAAQWLADRYKAPVPMKDNPLSLGSPEPANDSSRVGAIIDAFEATPEAARAAQPDYIEQANAAVSAAEQAAIAETAALFEEVPHVPESQESDSAAEPVADHVDSGADVAQDDAAEDVGDADAGPAGGGLQVRAHDGQDEPGDSDLPVDYEAEFEEVGEAAAVEGGDAEVPALEFGAEMAEHEEQTAEAPAGGVVYFGDDIHVARLAKMGRLLEIATEKKAGLQEGWTLDEFRSLQNLIVRIDRGEAPDDPSARERFDHISAYSRAMSHVDSRLGELEAELEGYGAMMKDEATREAGRDAILAFNPEEGWG